MLTTKEGKKSIGDEFEKTHDVVAKYVIMRHWRAPRLEGSAGIWQIIQASPKLKHYLSHSDMHADSQDCLRTADKPTILNEFLSTKKEIGLYRPTLADRKNVRLLFHVINRRPPPFRMCSTVS